MFDQCTMRRPSELYLLQFQRAASPRRIALHAAVPPTKASSPWPEWTSTLPVVVRHDSATCTRAPSQFAFPAASCRPAPTCSPHPQSFRPASSLQTENPPWYPTNARKQSLHRWQAAGARPRLKPTRNPPLPPVKSPWADASAAGCADTGARPQSRRMSPSPRRLPRPRTRPHPGPRRPALGRADTGPSWPLLCASGIRE